MLSMDVLNFDVLSHIFQYLDMKHLQNISSLGPAYDEAAQSVMRRRHSCQCIFLSSWFTVDCLRSYCSFIMSSVRKLTVTFSENDDINIRFSPVVVDMITDAERLVDLTLVYKFHRLSFGPRLLARVERLTLHKLANSDELVGQLLATSTPGRLVELHTIDMSLSGKFLAKLTGQLNALHMRNSCRLRTVALTNMVKRYPLLRSLCIEETYGMTSIRVPPLVPHLQHLLELRLSTHRLANLQLLAELPLLQYLRIRVDDELSPRHGGLESFTAAVGVGHPLRELCVISYDHQLTTAAGRHLHRCNRLERLLLCVQRGTNAREGVADLLLGLDGHPTLRHVRLQTGRGYGWMAVLAEPQVLHRHLQYIETLHTAARLRDDMLLLAKLGSLRTLKLNGLVARENADGVEGGGFGGDPMVIVNQLVRALAAQNQLVELHLQVDVGARECRFDGATLYALERFEQLRTLRLLGHYAWDTVTGLIASMPRLDVFENPGCVQRVADGRGYLRRMRPDLKRLYVSTNAESM